MTGQTCPLRDKPLRHRPLPGKVAPEKEEEEELEPVYGWCGLCHSFTEFPHECPGNGSSRGTDSSGDGDVS